MPIMQLFLFLLTLPSLGGANLAPPLMFFCDNFCLNFAMHLIFVLCFYMYMRIIKKKFLDRYLNFQGGSGPIQFTRFCKKWPFLRGLVPKKLFFLKFSCYAGSSYSKWGFQDPNEEFPPKKIDFDEINHPPWGPGHVSEKKN